MLSPPLTEWKPAELLLQGRDTATFEFALALCPACSSVLDLVQESNVSPSGGVPNAVRVLKTWSYECSVRNIPQFVWTAAEISSGPAKFGISLGRYRADMLGP